LLIKKGGGSGPLKPWQPPTFGKVPIPIPICREEISGRAQLNHFTLIFLIADLSNFDLKTRK